MTGTTAMEALHIRPGVVIPDSDLSVSFSRSTGPGGQNVNKVATRATLRFALAETQVLSGAVKKRLERLARRRLTQAGEIVISCQRHREQARNVEECRMRLRALVLEALVPPRRRRPSTPTRQSVERRLVEKTRHGEKKRRRALPEIEES